MCSVYDDVELLDWIRWAKESDSEGVPDFFGVLDVHLFQGSAHNFLGPVQAPGRRVQLRIESTDGHQGVVHALNRGSPGPHCPSRTHRQISVDNGSSGTNARTKRY